MILFAPNSENKAANACFFFVLSALNLRLSTSSIKKNRSRYTLISFGLLDLLKQGFGSALRSKKNHSKNERALLSRDPGRITSGDPLVSSFTKKAHPPLASIVLFSLNFVEARLTHPIKKVRPNFRWTFSFS